MRAMVCGAGIAGLTTAGLLARSGWDVDLVEHAAGPRGGYMMDFLAWTSWPWRAGTFSSRS